MSGSWRNASLSSGLNKPDCFKLLSTILDIADPRFSFFYNFLKLSFEDLSIDNGETATGKGFKFPLVISTSIKANALTGNKTININKYLNNILSF